MKEIKIKRRYDKFFSGYEHTFDIIILDGAPDFVPCGWYAAQAVRANVHSLTTLFITLLCEYR